MRTYGAQRFSAYLFLAPYALSFLVFIVVPICVALGLAFTQLDLTSRAPAHLVGLANFSEAVHDPYFRQSAVVNLQFALLMVPSLVVLAFGLALGLQAMPFGRNAVRGLIFLPGMFNVVVASLVWRWFYDGEFGLFNYLLKKVGIAPVHWLSEKSLAMPSIVTMSLWWGVGGATIIMYAALQQVPQFLYEAAMLDGASGRHAFSNVTLPQVRPVLLFVVVTSTIGAFQLFGQSYVMTNGGPERSTTGLVMLIYDTAFNKYRLGYASAISWLLFGMIAVFVFVQFLALRRSSD